MVAGARGAMIIIIGNGHNTSSILDEANCIYLRTNTLGKGMDPIIIPPDIGK